MLFCNLNLLSLRDFNFISSPLPLLLSFVQKLYYALFIKSAGIFLVQSMILEVYVLYIAHLPPHPSCLDIFPETIIFWLIQKERSDPELIFEQCFGEFYDGCFYINILAMIWHKNSDFTVCGPSHEIRFSLPLWGF